MLVCGCSGSNCSTTATSTVWTSRSIGDRALRRGQRAGEDQPAGSRLSARDAARPARRDGRAVHPARGPERPAARRAHRRRRGNVRGAAEARSCRSRAAGGARADRHEDREGQRRAEAAGRRRRAADRGALQRRRPLDDRRRALAAQALHRPHGDAVRPQLRGSPVAIRARHHAAEPSPQADPGGEANAEELTFWDDELSKDGGLLMQCRASALAEIGALAAEHHRALAPDEALDVSIRASARAATG